MAAAAILKCVYRPQLVYYCTYLNRIWHVYYVVYYYVLNGKIKKYKHEHYALA